MLHNDTDNGRVCVHAHEDFSNLPESLRTAFSEYFVVRAKSGNRGFCCNLDSALPTDLILSAGGIVTKTVFCICRLKIMNAV